MKAVLLTGFGGTDMLCYGDAPDPVAGPGDVVVDIHAASVNAADSKMRRGSYSDLTFPHILGRDFSGVVSAVGTGVDDLKVGDAVFGVTIAGTEGAYAEKIAINAAAAMVVCGVGGSSARMLAQSSALKTSRGRSMALRP
jgi:NADPH:quinone reductase-like Zn-dependent oxidoreductase